MNAQPALSKQVQRAQPPRRDDRTRVRGRAVVQGTEFDVRDWLEHYRAAHDDGNVADELAGVPFN